MISVSIVYLAQVYSNINLKQTCEELRTRPLKLNFFCNTLITLYKYEDVYNTNTVYILFCDIGFRLQ